LHTQPITIESLEDPRVAQYRNVRDPDLVGRRGVFLAEGELVVRTLLRTNAQGGKFRASSIFLSRTRLGTMADALEGLDQDCPVYIAEQGVFDEIVGFHIHRGALAVGERAEPLTMPGLIEAATSIGGPIIVLEDLANHDNVGGVFRNAAAFGAAGVLLTKRCCDPLYRKALRVSVGNVLSVPYAHTNSVEEACAALHQSGWSTIALTPNPEAAEISGLVASGGLNQRVAILLGAEGPGLTDTAMRAVSHLARIPIAEGVDSLNVVVAGAIALFALS
jgi:tRNA G18 (ribose-2'-O)-methylase SpoU